jgi:hypothetical protein
VIAYKIKIYAIADFPNSRKQAQIRGSGGIQKEMQSYRDSRFVLPGAPILFKSRRP